MSETQKRFELVLRVQKSGKVQIPKYMVDRFRLRGKLVRVVIEIV
jgi:hypothetical protein